MLGVVDELEVERGPVHGRVAAELVAADVERVRVALGDVQARLPGGVEHGRRDLRGAAADLLLVLRPDDDRAGKPRSTVRSPIASLSENVPPGGTSVSSRSSTPSLRFVIRSLVPGVERLVRRHPAVDPHRQRLCGRPLRLVRDDREASDAVPLDVAARSSALADAGTFSLVPAGRARPGRSRPRPRTRRRAPASRPARRARRSRPPRRPGDREPPRAVVGQGEEPRDPRVRDSRQPVRAGHLVGAERDAHGRRHEHPARSRPARPTTTGSGVGVVLRSSERERPDDASPRRRDRAPAPSGRRTVSMRSPRRTSAALTADRSTSFATLSSANSSAAFETATGAAPRRRRSACEASEPADRPEPVARLAAAATAAFQSGWTPSWFAAKVNDSSPAVKVTGTAPAREPAVELASACCFVRPPTSTPATDVPSASSRCEPE